MAIDYANLFATLGKLGKFQLAINTQQDAWDDKLEEIADAQDDQIARDAIADLLSAESLKSAREGVQEISSKIRDSAEAVLIAYVKADRPDRAGSLESALEELRRQMAADSESVKSATVSVSSSAFSSNSGNGALVTTTKRGDGKTQELIVAETGVLSCTADSQTGSATENQETFTYAGAADEGDRYRENWPTGSDGSASFTVIDPSQDDDLNVLTNSDFDSWSGSPLALDNWEKVAGTWATDLVREGTEVNIGTYSLKIIGDGSTSQQIRQQFNSVSGTTGTLLPLRSYALNFFAKVASTSGLSAGVLTVKLVDGNGSTISDDAGTANSTTFDITGWSTSWVAKNVVFRTPKLIPDTVYLVLVVSTPITSGKIAYLDDLAFGLTTPLYAGGPSVAVFPGSTRWVAGDGWKLTMANNRGGASFLASFNALFDRWFDMRSLQQLMPVAGSPTRADTLISS